MSTFDDIKLNDGRSIPGIGFGTWKIGSGQTVVDQVDQAVEVGFTHIDTAQIYRNEPETGDALAASGTSRDRFWITSKYAAIDPTLGIYDACKESVKRLKIDSLDLYLIHHPIFTNGDIPGAWAEMERVKKDGLAKSIGVSNFSIADLQVLLKHAKIKPAVNQIVLHPYVWKKQALLMAFQEEHGIVTEGYSPLAPLTTLPDGPVNKPIQRIAKRLQVAPEQVLIAWAKAKGAVVLTTSRKKFRLEAYLASGSLPLTPEDIDAIDVAGATIEPVAPMHPAPPPSSSMTAVSASQGRLGLPLMSVQSCAHGHAPPYPVSSQQKPPQYPSLPPRASPRHEVLPPYYSTYPSSPARFLDEKLHRSLPSFSKDIEAQATLLDADSEGALSELDVVERQKERLRRINVAVLIMLTMFAAYHWCCWAGFVGLMLEQRESPV